ncbi:MAG: 50S ribosomal protein L23 [Candidatus Eremiobacteraeota bacterium]|nr:50S ribosomal protein L23 [Candidatus Eremiobacteraeota bacterium]
MKDPRSIIRKPVITEKSMVLAADNIYTFEVDMRANKIEIRKAIEDIFDVKVLKVNTTMVRPKKRRFGRYEGMTRSWKKAVVKLKEGDRIELGGVNFFEV